MELGSGIYLYFALVLVFSIGIVLVFWLQRRRYSVEHFSEFGPIDGDVVVNLSLIARSFQKEMGKLAREVSKNISSLK